MFGVGGLQVIVSRRAPAIMRRWLWSRKAFNFDLHSSSRLGAGLGGVPKWRLLARVMWVRGLQGGLGVELIASLQGLYRWWPLGRSLIRLDGFQCRGLSWILNRVLQMRSALGGKRGL
ncbi:early-responsive to dehydration stress protein [Striga asiatica]|uniref:Early-responsive to dehydration stress protein n=1 Tax=Striga asiatica TaxID=4170 RepID=A0A5A7QIH7_STRAF|nr:early-responsive to dehydration stress protein [Striga asiatica]